MNFLALNQVETLTDIEDSQAWRLIGACNTSDPDLAFQADEDEGYERRAMRALCNSCPVKTECLDHAQVNNEPYGMWGGQTTTERKAAFPLWAKGKGKDGIRNARRKYSVAGLDAGQRERYDFRLKRAKECREKLWGEEGFEDHKEVLDLIINSPETSCTILAFRMGRSRSWFEQRFNDICELMDV